MQIVLHPYLPFVGWTVTGAISFPAHHPFSQEGPTADYVWQQQVSKEPNAASVMRVELDIPQPQAAELYYAGCGMIHKHNQC
jgi:hypothetical protein